MKEIKERIIAARALISKRENWTTGALARTIDGHSCHENFPLAHCYCGTGALSKCGITVPSVLFSELGAFDKDPSRQSIPIVNDTEGHEAVLALFDRAIIACDTVKPFLNPDYFLQTV